MILMTIFCLGALGFIIGSLFLNIFFSFFESERTPSTQPRKPLLIIGIKGRKDTGKSTVAEYLKEAYNMEEYYFSKPLKEIICILTGWSEDFVNGSTPEFKRLRETEKHPDFNMTCREMLVEIGTNLFRKQVNENVWVNIARWRSTQTGNALIFSDLRFPNECALVKELGGTIIRLKRDTDWELDESDETEQEFDTEGEIVIDNNGTLEELWEQIDNVIKTVCPYENLENLMESAYPQ